MMKTLVGLSKGRQPLSVLYIHKINQVNSHTGRTLMTVQ